MRTLRQIATSLAATPADMGEVELGETLFQKGVALTEKGLNAIYLAARDGNTDGLLTNGLANFIAYIEEQTGKLKFAVMWFTHGHWRTESRRLTDKTLWDLANKVYDPTNLQPS